MKQLTYGNNYATLNINYNSRLQITQFIGPAGLKGEFQYYDDGRIRFAKDLLSPIGKSVFDRSYEYDHMGRLAQALSGAEARGESPADGPYKQTYQRDVWGNLVARPINLFWGHDNGGYEGSFVNDRNQNWTYDVAGNVIQGAEGGGSYDAAGRKTSGPFIISLSYDGDGRFMRREEVHGFPTYSRTTYFIRSSVLGGKVVTEVDSSGQKQQAYVYANGELLVKQFMIVTQNRLSWQVQNPVTGGRREFNVGNAFGGGEYDPLGAITYYADPYESNPDPTYENTDGNRPLYYDDGNPFIPEGGCELDGMPVSCNFLLRRIENGPFQSQIPTGFTSRVVHMGPGIFVGQYFFGIDVNSDTEGWVAGSNGVVLHTTDQGKTWSEIKAALARHNNWFTDIKFIDTIHGWIVSTNGMIIYTRDGGSSWSEEYRKSGALFRKMASTSQGLFVVGDEMIILRRGL